MAYKYETDQQFMESIVRQASGSAQRWNGRNMLNSRPDNYVSAADNMQTRPDMHLPDPGFDDEEPQMKGYSSDSGHHGYQFADTPQQAPSAAGGMEPRMQMRKIKNEIKSLESKLHELQKQKVDLMRQITGRL